MRLMLYFLELQLEKFSRLQSIKYWCVLQRPTNKNPNSVKWEPKYPLVCTPKCSGEARYTAGAVPSTTGSVKAGSFKIAHIFHHKIDTTKLHTHSGNK